MDNVMKAIFGVMAAGAGLGGLLLASRGVDIGIHLFGLLLFAFAVFFNFWLIKRHFDESRLVPKTD
jgi:hypothetical protein